MPLSTDFTKTPEFSELEEQILADWQKNQAFEKSVTQRDPQKSYVFYDGPPFATGLPHYGHLLASTTKDVIPRYWTMKGYRVERVWGWDCHGLPIENMIEKKLDIKGGKKGIEALGIDTFNQACRAEVLRLDKEWERIIGRLGRWVDFEHNYKTMDATFMESVWWGFKQLYEKELVYEGRKVILYCPRCATPLSNFEIAMDNSYKEVTDAGTTYKYQVQGQEKTYLLAWSTTPWNKLVTPALAVNPKLKYVKVKQDDEYYILAETTLQMLTDQPYQVVEEYTGAELEKLTFEVHYQFYPLQAGEKAGVVIADEFVTAQEGTGIVTLAVYGEDDYRVMKEHRIQLAEHVDEEGKLKPEITPWAGQFILKANPLVNADLAARGLVYKDEAYVHSVPTCYRCGTRLYNAPLPAWFIKVGQLRNDLINQNEKINWVPEHLKQGRFKKGLENAPDWNISRSRYWGTPMPIWQSADGQHRRVIGSIAELKTWAVQPEQVAQLTDIHREYLDDVQLWVDDAKTVVGTRISEVFDCWVESGSMPFAALHYPFEHKAEFEAHFPAQFVSEYIAQTRAWFYTMHVMSVAIFGTPSFENVLTTGTILAEDGSKMSKSKNNYPDPMILINKYGVDSLRLYLMSSTVMKSENLNFSEKEVSDLRRKVFVIWWNVLAFYQTFANKSAGFAAPTQSPTHVMDQWLVSRVNHVVEQVTEYMDSYDVIRASRTLIEMIDELSTWYLRLSRDRIKNDSTGQAGQVFGYALYTVAQLFAPLTPFFAEVVHQTLTQQTTSIHHGDWPVVNPLVVSPVLEATMSELKKVVEKGHAMRKEHNLKVRQPLASVTVVSTVTKPSDQLLDVLKQELNVKDVTWLIGGELAIQLNMILTPELKAEGEAREVMRKIQQLRKEAGLDHTQHVKVQLPSWPAEWQSEIETKTNTTVVSGEPAQLL